MSSPEGRRRGIARDLQTAREGTAASATELREFVAQFRGKRSDEVMGLITSNGLVRATTLATVATVALLAVFTVMPFAMNRIWPKPVAEKAKPSEPAAATAKTETPSAAAAPAANKPAKDPTDAALDVVTTPAESKSPSGASKEDTLKKLDLETKNADPKVNPLENASDDLLKDLP